jgi:type VII secretion ATPase EccA
LPPQRHERPNKPLYLNTEQTNINCATIIFKQLDDASDTATARRHFDRAMNTFHADPVRALAEFKHATTCDPSMADAWLGRIAAGDDALDTLQQLYDTGDRLHRETNRLGAQLSAAISCGPFMAIEVTDASQVGLALASALIDDGQYSEADNRLADPVLRQEWVGHHWHQHLRAYLHYVTQRWADVMTIAAEVLPAQAIIQPALTAANNALAAESAVHLGQARVGLQWADRVEVRTRGQVPDRHHGADTAIDPNKFPMIAAHIAYVRGMAHRQLGQEDKAQVWLSKATVNGQLTADAKAALSEPDLQLLVTDEETINTRTNKWDVATERTQADREEELNEERRAELLAQGREELQNQVGLTAVKQAVAELEDQIEVRALRLARGLPVSGQTNHLLLVGPPGTGKTSTAQALGKIYAGLGVVRHPEIIEVTREDFCGQGYIAQAGPRTNELIKRSLGRIVFMDEFYTLVERHQDGRPDIIGMEAVNRLMVALEQHRFDFCFIGAGYEKQIDEFLTVNPGLAGRFNRKLRFPSYSPDELVEIAVRYGGPRATFLTPQASAALLDACWRLQAYTTPDGENGIDYLHNGRFARNVLERAEKKRDSRTAPKIRADPDSVSDEDLTTLQVDDITAALQEVLSDKDPPITL